MCFLAFIPMTKCLFNALLFTTMEIVFPALLYQKSGSVKLTLFWAKLCRHLPHYDYKIQTLCRHSSSELQPFQVLKDLMETLQRNNVNCQKGLGNLPVTKHLARLGNESLGLGCVGSREALSWRWRTPLFPNDTSTTQEGQGMKHLQVVKYGQREKWHQGDGEKYCYSPQKASRNSRWKKSTLLFQYEKRSRREKAL